MADYRTELLRQAENELAVLISSDEFEQTMIALTKILESYDIEKRTTDLAPKLDINEILLKRYCACLMISGKSEKTIAQYKRTAEKLARFLGKEFTDITAYDIRLFLAMEKQRGISNRTLENTRTNISAFFQWLFLEDEISKNPCWNVQKIKFTDKVRLPFSQIDIDAIRFACRTSKERAIVELLLSTGIRVSEMTGLQISDVDFDDMSVYVRKGKGAKERKVYMNDIARKHLKQYLSERAIFSNSLFINKKKDPLNPGGVRYILNQIGKRANVENVHPHRFRRTFATNLASRGMDIQEIRKLLGHENLNTTLEYVYSSDEITRAAYLRFTA